MKRILCLFIFIGIVFSPEILYAQKPISKNIVVIHSYSMDYEWTAGEDYGVEKAVEMFQKQGIFNTNLTKFFLEGKKNKESPKLIEHKIEEVKAYIKQHKPEGVILTDDLAFKVFYDFLSDLGVAFTFCGINGEIEQYGYSSQAKNITGTLERYNLIPTLEIITQLRPSIDTVVFIGDISLTTDVLFGGLKSQNLEEKLALTPIKNIKYFAKEYFHELQSFLLSLDQNKTAVVYMSPYTYIDKNGNHVSYREVDKWTSENTKVIDAGITVYQVNNGRLLSLASNQVESGYYAANALLQGFKEKKDLSFYPIRQELPLQLLLNSNRAKDLGIELTYELLSYSRQSQKLFDSYKMP